MSQSNICLNYKELALYTLVGCSWCCTGLVFGLYFYKQTTNLLTTCRAQQDRDLVHILCHIDAFESTFVNSFVSSGVGTHYILVLKTP